MAVLEHYKLHTRDIEDAVNQMLGRDPEQESPAELSWTPLVSAMHEAGIEANEMQLRAAPFRFEFAEEVLAQIGSEQ